MLKAYKNGDEIGTKKNAEVIMNVLVGSQSHEYKDWDGDGQITDTGSGYGFLLNANNLGHIQAVYSHADYAANSPGASQTMISNGEDVKTCAQNFAQWVPELRDRILIILKADFLSEIDRAISDSVALADNMLNGIDANQNGTIELEAGECGMLTTYESAYHMADMPLLPVNLPVTPTTATNTPSTFVPPTNTRVLPPGEPQNTAIPPTVDTSPNNPPNNPPGNPRPTRKPPRPTNTPRN
jgi:hypothetical protein